MWLIRAEDLADAWNGHSIGTIVQYNHRPCGFNTTISDILCFLLPLVLLPVVPTLSANPLDRSDSFVTNSIAETYY